MKMLLFIISILILTLQDISAQSYTPADYFPLAIGNHWKFETVIDTTYPFPDRWSFIDVVDTITFGIPGETVSYKVVYSENLFGYQDTNIYRIAYYSYNTNGDLGYTAAVIDSLIILDSLTVFLRNPIAVGDSILLGIISGYGESITVVSVTDTLNLTLGYFENCLHIRDRSFFNGQPLEEIDQFFIPISYLPTAAGNGRNKGTHWYIYPDSSRYGYSNLVECDVQPTPPSYVESNSSPILQNFSLWQNYPNSFNPSTTIRFSIPKEVQVNLSVYNILGEKVKELKNELMKPGYFKVEFNASAVVSGVYFYRIKAGDFVQTKKMILLK